ncbi:MAG: hypothetical protein HUJ54_08275, partial [Erysipelotrichaceae bacterium]|nr:hypothetical protein [Erysipelotrichaceae bacterium]
MFKKLLAAGLAAALMFGSGGLHAFANEQNRYKESREDFVQDGLSFYSILRTDDDPSPQDLPALMKKTLTSHPDGAKPLLYYWA